MCWYLSGWIGDEVDGVVPAAIIVTSIKIYNYLIEQTLVSSLICLNNTYNQ